MSPSKPSGDGKRGYLFPIGGAEDKEGSSEILRKFVELSGGKQARIVVIPTASQMPDTGARYERLFEKLGVELVTALPVLKREDAGPGVWCTQIEASTGIFITGGNQLRLSTIIGGTPMARAIRKANAHGVTVGGTSAGAAVLSEHMIAYGKNDGVTPHAGKVTLVPGFGLTNRMMIDMHFGERERLGRLLGAIAYNPFAVGIGIDEDTAAIMDHAKRLTVIGRGAVFIVDASELGHSSIADLKPGKPVMMTNVRLHVLTNGATFDLETRVAAPRG